MQHCGGRDVVPVVPRRDFGATAGSLNVDQPFIGGRTSRRRTIAEFPSTARSRDDPGIDVLQELALLVVERMRIQSRKTSLAAPSPVTPVDAW
jgi:hypothetical protein